ncbi:hypothetical protein LIER_13358 [Lithospermum erythrorhizon]|uniref:Uncharacterized protein n=1 Tax=Lithospermum erythrorhizon TaxID=34254 RepID=A0AAV3PVK1_LITER
MCIQGMHWDLEYILQGILSKTFEQLSTRTHDMKLTIAANKERGMSTSTSMLYNAKSKDADLEEPYKEDVHVTTFKSTKSSFKTKRTQGDTKYEIRSRQTLKEMQAKEYPFFDSDVPTILE